MARVSYEKLFQFRGNKVHSNIIKKYLEKNPKLSTEADVLRHAVALLDEKMRRDNEQDEMSSLIKKVSEMDRSNNALRIQMDVLIKLTMELISRSGSDLTWEDTEQEIKDKIGSSVTKKSENRFTRTTNRVQLDSKLEGNTTISSVQEIKQQPLMSKEVLPMISDEDKILMKYGKPHKAIIRGGRMFYEEIKWEQIPEHRRSELE